MWKIYFPYHQWAAQDNTTKVEEGHTMTLSEWKTLDFIGVPKTNREKQQYEELIEKTKAEDEHPEFYDGPCMCKMCQSYS